MNSMKSVRSPRVVIISTDAVYRGILSQAFDKEGWEVLTSPRAEDAERRSVQFIPHVVLLLGEELAQVVTLLDRWKALPTLAKTRVIVEMSSLRPGMPELLHEHGARAVFLRGHALPQDMVRRAAKELSSSFYA